MRLFFYNVTHCIHMLTSFVVQFSIRLYIFLYLIYGHYTDKCPVQFWIWPVDDSKNKLLEVYLFYMVFGIEWRRCSCTVIVCHVDTYLSRIKNCPDSMSLLCFSCIHWNVLFLTGDAGISITKLKFEKSYRLIYWYIAMPSLVFMRQSL